MTFSWIASSFVILFPCFLYAEKQPTFTTHENYRYTNHNPKIILKSRSRLECASFCETDGSCLSFHFDKQVCTLNKKEDESHGKVYRKRKYCPTEMDYKLHKKGSVELCVKFTAAEATQYEASIHCARDGGHLLFITNEAVYKFAIEMINGTNSGVSWIEGECRQESKKGAYNRVFKTSNGEALPYINWALGNPDSALPACIRLEQRHNFLFADWQCTRQFPYFCQID